VRHGLLEALACLLDEALLEPVGASRWVRRQQNLLGLEFHQRVFDGVQRLGVAAPAPGIDAAPAQRSDRGGHALVGCPI
jgi:hypothetical protein